MNSPRNKARKLARRKGERREVFQGLPRIGGTVANSFARNQIALYLWETERKDGYWPWWANRVTMDWSPPTWTGTPPLDKTMDGKGQQNFMSPTHTENDVDLVIPDRL